MKTYLLHCWNASFEGQEVWDSELPAHRKIHIFKTTTKTNQKLLS